MATAITRLVTEFTLREAEAILRQYGTSPREIANIRPHLMCRLAHCGHISFDESVVLVERVGRDRGLFLIHAHHVTTYPGDMKVMGNIPLEEFADKFLAAANNFRHRTSGKKKGHRSQREKPEDRVSRGFQMAAGWGS